jgi:hypothetical protein
MDDVVLRKFRFTKQWTTVKSISARDKDASITVIIAFSVGKPAHLSARGVIALAHGRYALAARLLKASCEEAAGRTYTVISRPLGEALYGASRFHEAEPVLKDVEPG